MDTEPGVLYDVLQIVVAAGGTEQVVWDKADYLAATTMQTWLPVAVALDAWQGLTVQVGFVFFTTDAAFNDTEGVYVDDVRIVAPCTAGP